MFTAKQENKAPTDEHPPKALRPSPDLGACHSRPPPGPLPQSEPWAKKRRRRAILRSGTGLRHANLLLFLLCGAHLLNSWVSYA